MQGRSPNHSKQLTRYRYYDTRQQRPYRPGAITHATQGPLELLGHWGLAMVRALGPPEAPPHAPQL